MQGIALVGAGLALLTTLGIGLVAHELTHAAVLHAFGVPYDIRWFPGQAADDSLNAGVSSAWATVTPRRIPPGMSAWTLRLSAVAPLALAAPFLLVPAGVLPDPLAGPAPVVAATVAWLGCALPSPRDFSLFWGADQVVANPQRCGDGQ